MTSIGKILTRCSGTYSVDRELGAGIGARISYIGMKTDQLVWAPNYNDMTPSSTWRSRVRSVIACFPTGVRFRTAPQVQLRPTTPCSLKRDAVFARD